MKIKYILIVFTSLMAAGCDTLDTKIDTLFTEEQLASGYSRLYNLGYAPYSFIQSGFYALDSNIDAAKSDEAAYTKTVSSVKYFNEGTWNQYNNPDDVYANCYKGIRAANFFLDYSVNYKEQLYQNRDTLSDGGNDYRRSVQNIAWMRAEAHVLRAWFYFELMKRYGGVPLVKEVLSPDEKSDLPRADFDDIVNYAVSEIDYVLDSLQQLTWKSSSYSGYDGRFAKGSAMALKSRILLYAASPLHNPENDAEKWESAAKAAYDVIQLTQYSLDADYRALFLETNAVTSNEVILSYRSGSTNGPEKANYPIGTPGGNSGVTPSQNLVSAYEYKGTPDPADPYANRDPRLAYSIVTNNSSWNGRTMQIYTGGDDDPAKANASRTGYYLKKFLLNNLDLTNDEKRIHNWIMFRYAEILLNYAEAMNEAYGPDDNKGYSMTAREAVNAVRSRTSVQMPAVDVAAGDKDEMRKKIKHERRIELAFEGHRFWDLLRWKDAEIYLNQDLKGISVMQTDNNSFNYREFTLGKRIFDASKMYLYPIPNTEIVKSNNILEQNSNW
ncbi:MAG: RagB/SusD family nutrient uptake outer membrane protein [Candidatus Symbiothrix sp.]|nr:RagB/SusD family nutrient uptake outer membrane protein [Candidatus Symbiothrix sp.]